MYLGQNQLTTVVQRVPASFVSAMEGDPTMLEAFQPESGVVDLTLYDEAGGVVSALVSPDEGITPIGPPSPDDEEPEPFQPPPPIIQPRPGTQVQPFVSVSPVPGVTQPSVMKPYYDYDILGPDVPEDVTEVDPGVVFDEFAEREARAGFPWWMLLVAGGVYLATKKK